MKYFILLFTLLFHSLVYSQLNTSNRTVNQKLNFKAGANFDSLTASTLLVLDGSKNLTSSSVTQTNLDFIDNLLGLDTNGDGLMVFNDSTDAFSSVTITGTSDAITVTNGDGIAGAPTIDIADNPILGGTEGVTIPNGTTAQRPVSPNTGELRWNTTDTAAEIYDGTDWSAVGGGLGSAQTISIVQADDDSTDFSGNDATFDGAGASINGSITENTTSSNFLTGEKKVYFYDASATPQNDYFGWTRNIPQGWRGRTIAYEFTYRTDAVYQNGDIVWQIKDNTNGDLLIINGLPLDQANNANGNGETIRGLVNIPEDAASLDFGFQVTGTTASFDFFVDKISLDIDDFNYKNFTEVYSLRAEGNGAEVLTAGVTDVTYTEVSDTGNAWDGTTYTVQSSNSVIEIKTNVNATTTAARYLRLYKNGSSYKIIGDQVSANIHAGAYVSDKGEFAAGDSLSIRVESNNANLNNTTIFHYLTINEHLPTTKHVVVDSGDAETEQYSIDHITSNFWDTLAQTTNFDTSLIPLTNSNFIEWNDTTQTRLVAKQDIILNYSITGRQNVGTSIKALTSSGAYLSFEYAASSTTWNTTQGEVKLTTGDYIYFERDSATSGSRAGGITLTARKATQGEYHLVPVTDQENVFSARINGSGTVVSENLDWIDGNCSVSASDFTCNYISSLGNTSAMSCSAVTNEIDNNRSMTVQSNVGGFVASVFTISGNPTSQPFMVICQKQGADYKEPKAFIGNITPTEFVQTPNSSMPVIYSVKVSDGAATTTISQEYSAWINGVCSNASAGNYVCTLENGVFSASPNCTASATSSYNSAAVVAASASSINVVLRDVSSGSNADGDFFLMCHGVQ